MYREWAVLAKRIIGTNFQRLDRPYKLLYVVTKECHSRCVNCDIWKIKPKNELTLDEVTNLAKNSNFLSWIDFTGGEPTDRRDFTQVVETFREHCRDLLLIHFPTNGLNTKRIVEVCRELAKRNGPSIMVTVSIDGPPEINDQLRGIPRDFDRAIDTYSQLTNLRGIKPYVGMTLYPQNVALIDQTILAIKKVAPRFNGHNLHLNLPHVSEHYYANQSQAPSATAEMGEAIRALMATRPLGLDPFQWVERLYQRKIKDYLETRKCPTDCTALLASCYLSETGVVYPCSIWNEPLGSIRDTGYDLVPLLKSPLAGDLRERLLCKDCPNCWTPCEAYPSLVGNLINFRKRRGNSR